MAFSKDEVIDVTWRYSAKHEEVRLRRTECPEDWLAHTLYSLNKQIQKRLPAPRVAELQRRSVQESVEFLTIRTPDGEEHQGRTSGSVEWRKARGELGKQPKPHKETINYIFKPTNEELAAGVLCFCYSPIQDAYYRSMAGDIEQGSAPTLKGWSSGAFKFTHIFRKEEHDWNMVYLAREGTASSGSVSWKVDLSGTGFVVDCALIKAQHACFSDGEVQWTIKAGDIEQCSVPLGGKLCGTSVKELWCHCFLRVFCCYRT
jgi:peptide-N4-(N-acetyl-beta-glucosaminyl)asparagine amidase